MEIIGFVGSPRRGRNTQGLVEAVLNSAAKQGAGVKLYNLNDLVYKGCQGCNACKKAGSCVLQDDITPILKEISACDAIVLGTPVYMWQMSGQLKLLVDRFYAYFNPVEVKSSLPPGKKVLLAVSQGNPDERFFLPYFKSTGDMLNLIGFGSYEILACAGNIAKSEDALARAENAAAWLTKG